MVKLMKRKKFETRVWPGYWEGEKPVVNFKTKNQKLKLSFLQREDGDYVCVFHTGEELIRYLDDSPFTEDKYYDSSNYYNWPIIRGQVLALQHNIMLNFNTSLDV